MNNGMLESNYTLELRYICSVEDHKKLFDFEYSFYEPTLKDLFEKTFVETYFFNEIGFETIGRFKFMLKAHLNKVMPIYKQMYDIELKSKNANFLFNKDLKETTIRDLVNNTNEKSNSNNLTDTTTINNNNNIDSFEESNLDNGIADLVTDKLTTVNKNTTTSNDNSNTKSNDKYINDLNKNQNEKEEITLLSQGNIGITSTAELIEGWRKILIDINVLIIDSCRDLFMLIY